MSLPLIVLFVSACVHLSSYVLLACRVEPFMYQFYMVAWWSYIVGLDAALALKNRRFLILNRTLPFLIVISSAFWCVFELINLRIQNWYYINVPSSVLIRFPGYLLAYGTVIPGLYITKEAFSELLGSIRVRPLSFHVPPRYSMLFGVLLFPVFMLFPAHCFFLAWLFLIPILEGYNQSKGYWCFTKDLQEGEAGNLIASALAGLFCGFLWETWNYWAIAKWVYTVPFFESFKLFEMPAPGYLGFILFSLETMLFLALIRPNLSMRRHEAAIIAAALAFSCMSFAAIDRYTVFSFTDTIDQLNFLPVSKREELKSQHVKTSFAIDPQELTSGERKTLALLHLKGLGMANVEKLRKAGIESVPQLARMTEEELSTVIGEKNRQRLRVYVRAARDYLPRSSY